MSLVYIIKNDLNNKVYIGQTSQSVEARYSKHKSAAKYGLDRHLYRAMRKYGIEHFWAEVIEYTDNPNEREQYWIQKYDSVKNGYNETLGGEGAPLYDYQEIEACYKTFGNVADTVKACGASLKTVNTVLSMRGIHSEIRNKAVNMIDENNTKAQTFDSLTNAANYIQRAKGLSTPAKPIADAISECAKGKRKTAYGFRWEYVDEKNITKVQKRCMINCYDVNDNFVASYMSLADAAAAVNGNFSVIRKCCLGIVKTHRGFKWAFGEELIRTILQIDMNSLEVLKKWNSINEIRCEMKVTSDRIQECVAKSGKTKAAAGYYWCYEDEYESFLKNPPVIKPSTVKVLRFDLNMNFVKEYDSLKDAMKDLGMGNLNSAAIIRCCKGKAKTAYGSIWKYSSDCELKAS